MAKSLDHNINLKFYNKISSICQMKKMNQLGKTKQNLKIFLTYSALEKAGDHLLEMSHKQV